MRRCLLLLVVFALAAGQARAQEQDGGYRLVDGVLELHIHGPG